MNSLRPRTHTRRNLWQSTASALALVVLATATAPVFAETTGADGPPYSKPTCFKTADAAQKLRVSGKLRSAREQLGVCVHESCPDVVRIDCTKWLAEVSEIMPSVVVLATDHKGTDVFDVKVFVDDVRIMDGLDGKPVGVDPGKHKFKFERVGSKTVELDFLIVTGQRNRKLELKFPAPEGFVEDAGPTDAKTDAVTPETDTGVTEPPAPTGIPTATWIFGGVGVAALASFAVFGLTGRSDYSKLSDSCKPFCSDSDISSVRSKLLIADISLGIGIASLGLATVFALTAGPARPDKVADKKTSMDVHVLPGGGFASISGHF